MQNTVRKLLGAAMLAAVIVPANAHAAAGCIAYPVNPPSPIQASSSCSYHSAGGDVNYQVVGLTGGNINVIRFYSGVPKIIYSLNIPTSAGPTASGTISAFANAFAPGNPEDSVQPGDTISADGGHLPSPLPSAGSLIKVDDAA